MSSYREFKRHFYPVQIVFCPSKKSWARLSSRCNADTELPSEHGSCALLTDSDGCKYIAITIGPDLGGMGELEIFGVAAHEAVHVTHHVRDVISGPLDDESQAYLVQALTIWLVTEYSRSRKPAAHKPRRRNTCSSRKPKPR